MNIFIESFQNVEFWISLFFEFGVPQKHENIPIIIIGNKIDRQTEREVDEESVTELMSKHPGIKHILTSAINREGVEVAFKQIAFTSQNFKSTQFVA